MNQAKEPNNDEKPKNKVFFRGGFYWIAAGALILAAVVVWYSRVFPTLEGQYTFIGQNVLNVLIIAAIAVQALIYRRQWDSMQDGLGQTDRVLDKMEGQLNTMVNQEGHMKTQAEAVLRQLNVIERQEGVLREQAKIMDRSLVLGTRAYVGVHSIVFDPHKKRIFLQIENIGKVPANKIEVTVEITIRISDHFMPFPLPSTLGSSGWGNVGWSYHPGNPDSADVGSRFGEWELRIPWLHPYGRTKLFPGSLRIGIVIRLDEIAYILTDQYAEIAAGNALMSLNGVIIYSDGFHSGKKTEFSFLHYPKDNLWISQPVIGLEFHADREKPDSDYNPN